MSMTFGKEQREGYFEPMGTVLHGPHHFGVCFDICRSSG